MKEKQITTKSRTARQNRTFRLSDYELRKLSEGAKAAGMNESQYVRELIIHGGDYGNNKDYVYEGFKAGECGCSSEAFLSLYL